jgi:hypothetical protein
MSGHRNVPCGGALRIDPSVLRSPPSPAQRAPRVGWAWEYMYFKFEPQFANATCRWLADVLLPAFLSPRRPSSVRTALEQPMT